MQRLFNKCSARAKQAALKEKPEPSHIAISLRLCHLGYEPKGADAGLLDKLVA